MEKKKSNKKLSGRGCRAKGHGFEREMAIAFKKIGFTDARRHLENHKEDAKGFDLANVWPYLVQCKRNRGYASITKIEEVQLDPFDPGVPILITKGDNKPPMAVMPLEHFLELVRKSRA